MIITKHKTITELRNTLFETFEQVVSGEPQVITHKNGKKLAMVSADIIDELNEQIELHKNLAIGYAQALRGEGISSNQLKDKLKAKEKALKAKYG
ncbi:MAG: type II toxin-antitoxin system prevent-host-death family antitoxin [Gammaproteobacteria bacterium]|nr:type II toxin-antitoxin system prevent-host-death family antitoxin [Gammaproteobacteria bacterium]